MLTDGHKRQRVVAFRKSFERYAQEGEDLFKTLLSRAMPRGFVTSRPRNMWQEIRRRRRRRERRSRRHSAKGTGRTTFCEVSMLNLSKRLRKRIDRDGDCRWDFVKLK